MTRPKLPSEMILRRHLSDGMTRTEITNLYGVHSDTLRVKLKELGLLAVNHAKPAPSFDVFARDKVISDLRSGFTFAAIDRKYGATTGTAKRYAVAEGLLDHMKDFEIRDDRIVVGKRFTASESGGTAYMQVSLPRISMYAAELLESGRC